MPGLPAGVRASKAGRFTCLALVLLACLIALNYYGSAPGRGWMEMNIEALQGGTHAEVNPDTLTGDETWDNFIATHTSTATSTSLPILPTTPDHPSDHTNLETSELNEFQTHHHTSANPHDTEELYSGPPTRARTHQRYLTLATMFKNQRRWLREWIEFNLMVGVEHFLLYDNNSTDLPLEIIQPYINQGLVTYIPWPPQAVPPPIEATSVFEQEQDGWFRDSLETCLYSNFTIHKQGPCQMAAFIDAIRRTKNGVSRWLGIWDVDEYIFPRRTSEYKTLPEFLQGRYESYSCVQIWGFVFGTGGHVELPQRREGDPFPPLMAESYVYRSSWNRDPEEGTPEKLGIHDEIEVHDGVGRLSAVQFGGGDEFARKSFADPDTVLFTYIHHFIATGPRVPDWNDDIVYSGTDVDMRFNHYAYLSQTDAHRKAQANKNPYMDFDEDVDDFFSQIYDAEIFYLLPNLVRRILRSLQAHPPRHPDDWVPSAPRQ